MKQNVRWTFHQAKGDNLKLIGRLTDEALNKCTTRTAYYQVPHVYIFPSWLPKYLPSDPIRKIQWIPLVVKEVAVDRIVERKSLTAVLTNSMCLSPEPVMLLSESLRMMLAITQRFNARTTYTRSLCIPFFSHFRRINPPALGVSSKHLPTLTAREFRIAISIFKYSITIDPNSVPIFRYEPFPIFSDLRIVPFEASGGVCKCCSTVQLFL